MKRALKFNNQLLFDIQIAVYIVALVYSVFALSLAMLSMFLVTTLFEFEISKSKFDFRINPKLGTHLKGFLKRPDYWSITLIFWLTLISGINSADLGNWYHHLELKLPFLILPFVFYCRPALDKESLYRWIRFFILFMALSSLSVLFNYFSNYDQITLLIGQGHPVPTPTSHIRFSLFLALAAVCSTILFISPLADRGKNYWWIIINVYFFVVLHLLAVRSGIAVMYLAYSALIVVQIFVRRKSLSTVVLALGIIIAPFLAYQTIPSFHNKVRYTLWDIGKFNQKDARNYSDSGRMYSIIAGIDIFKQHPILGTGIGDLKSACTVEYERMFNDTPKVVKYPHNQFVYFLAGTGILGFLFFLVAILTPFFYQKNYRHPMLFVLSVIVFSSFLVENTIERSNGIGFYLLFLLLILNHIRYRHINEAQ